MPELTRYGGGTLTSSKYFGKAGLDALRAMLMHADHYGLKWVFVRDPYYDPLLYFAGWRPVDNLEDKTITVWSKDGVPPATPVNAPQIPPHWQGLMWGILPFGSSILAILVVLIPAKRRDESATEHRLSTESASRAWEVGLVNKGPLLAAFLAIATIALVVIGTVWPVPAALAYAGGRKPVAFHPRRPKRRLQIWRMKFARRSGA